MKSICNIFDSRYINSFLHFRTLKKFRNSKQYGQFLTVWTVWTVPNSMNSMNSS